MLHHLYDIAPEPFDGVWVVGRVTGERVAAGGRVGARESAPAHQTVTMATLLRTGSRNHLDGVDLELRTSRT